MCDYKTYRKFTKGISRCLTRTWIEKVFYTDYGYNISIHFDKKRTKHDGYTNNIILPHNDLFSIRELKQIYDSNDESYYSVRESYDMVTITYYATCPNAFHILDFQCFIILLIIILGLICFIIFENCKFWLIFSTPLFAGILLLLGRLFYMWYNYRERMYHKKIKTTKEIIITPEEFAKFY